MEMIVVLFWVIASLILASAWAVVNGNDIVHAVVWLSAVYFCVLCRADVRNDAIFSADKNAGVDCRDSLVFGESRRARHGAGIYRNDERRLFSAVW